MQQKIKQGLITSVSVGAVVEDIVFEQDDDGKEKDVGYWKCNGCFDEAQHECWLEDILMKLYGKKCKDFEKNCGGCQAWSVYTTIIEHNRGRL